MPGVSRRKALAATLFGSLAAVGSIALGSIDYGLEVTKLEVGLGEGSRSSPTSTTTSAARPTSMAPSRPSSA